MAKIQEKIFCSDENESPGLKAFNGEGYSVSAFFMMFAIHTIPY